MKKTLCTLITLCLIFACVGCGNKISSQVPDKTVDNICGEWKIANVEKNENDGTELEKVMNTLAEEYIADGMTVEFKEDGTGRIGDESITYTLDGNVLSITWGKTKKLGFKAGKTDNGIIIAYNNFLKAELVK